MRDRSLPIVVSVVVVLLVGAGALYAYDASQKSQIAKGVRVGGIDIGGLSRVDAHRRVSQRLRVRLGQSIVVRQGARSFRLTPRQAGASFDVDAMVGEAVARSREGSIFTRTLRSLRGQSLPASLPARVRYSPLVVTRFVDRVERKLNRRPQDARLDFGADGEFTRVAGKPGLTIDSRALRAGLVSAITGTRPAVIAVRARRIEPRIKKADLARRYPQLITINRSAFRLRFWRHLKLVKTYPIAVGQVGLETPAGLYHVQNKAVDPAWSVPNAAWAGSLAGQVIPGGAPDNPLKARWLGIFNGAGIHGTADIGSLGSAASHGCIRMAVPDVIELYDEVPVQTPVYIA
jgi:lipoprotein-anchoring transpeptidase ErfK/SrfK